jgi:multidrug efflux pump subunit AcrB
MENNRDKQTKEINSSSLLSRWSSFFIKNYKISILLIIAMLVAGIWGLFNNQRQDFPTIESNYVSISARYIGASASDIEREVINPIEATLSSQDIEIKTLRSSATNHAGFIMVELEKVDEAAESAAKISEVVSSLSFPQGVEVKSELLEVMGPTIAYAVYSDELNKNDLLEKAPAIANFLESATDDIKKIDVIPNPKTQIEVILDPEKVANFKLSQDLITNSIRSYVSTLPGGVITTEDNINKPINIVAPISNLEDLQNIAIGPIKLSDIAEVKRTIIEDNNLTYAGFIKDGKPTSKNSIYLMVYKTKNGDIINISQKTDEAVSQIYEKNIASENIKIAKVYDTTPAIQDQISTLVNNGIFGLILILITLMFFINFRAGIMVALIIPLALLLTLFLLPLLGFTINILTLFAMILTLGILVDNAIVITEGIVFRIEKGMNKLEASIQAVKDLGPAVTGATITTFIVFIPFAMMSGIMGEIMKYIPYTIMTMIAGSYLLAVTLTPLFGRWILKSKTDKPEKTHNLKTWQKVLILPALIFYFQKALDYIIEKYGRFMKKILTKSLSRWAVVSVTFILLLVSIFGFGPILKFESFPSNDSNVININFEYPSGTNLLTKEELAQKVGKEISELPHFESYFVFDNSVTALFTEPKDRTDGMTISQINQKLEERLEPIRKNLKPDTYIKSSAATYGPPEEAFDLIVEFTSDDETALQKATGELEKHLQSLDKVERIVNSNQAGLVSSVEVNLKKDELAKLQINPFLASQAINAFFSQSEAGSVSLKPDGTSEKIFVVYPEKSKQSIDSVKEIFIPTSQGTLVKLADVSEIKEVERLESIDHLNSKKVSSLKAALKDGENKQAFEAEIKNYLNEDKLKEFNLGKDDVSFGGFAASLNQDFSELGLIFILAILSIFIVLVYQFRSYSQPFLIMLTIPIAFIGILPGLKLVGSSINMISGLGVIAVVGIVVNDAIVFIDAANRLRKEYPQKNLLEALVEVGKSRIKPILSTSLTTIFGILSITVVDPFWVGLGTSIIAGLTFSTLGTLIVIPNLIYLFARKKNRGALA